MFWKKDRFETHFVEFPAFKGHIVVFFCTPVVLTGAIRPYDSRCSTLVFIILITDNKSLFLRLPACFFVYTATITLRLIRSTSHDDSQSRTETPLLTPVLIIFMLAMILANLGGSMYGPLLSTLRTSAPPSRRSGCFTPCRRSCRFCCRSWAGGSRIRSAGCAPLPSAASSAPSRRSSSSLHQLGLGAALQRGRGWSALAGRTQFRRLHRGEIHQQNRARVFGVSQMLFGIVSVIGPPLAAGSCRTTASKPCWGQRPSSTSSPRSSASLMARVRPA